MAAQHAGGTYATRYKFNGKELDPQTGYYYYGARYYDPVVSRWLSIDPLAEKYPGLSPYNYTANNPVMLVDPDGKGTNENEWVPDSDGNLIAEEGDNIQTLADFQNISYSEAENQLREQGYIDKKGNLTLKAGDKVELDNVYTRSIKRSKSNLTLDRALEGAEINEADPNDNYNCWGSAISGSKDQEIIVGVGIPIGDLFDNILLTEYHPVTLSEAKFGRTVLRFADENNVVQHGAVFYGRSHDGTIYVYTKNGWYLKPEVMKLSDLLEKIPSYGTVQGIYPTHTGYYNPN